MPRKITENISTESNRKINKPPELAKEQLAARAGSHQKRIKYGLSAVTLATVLALIVGLYPQNHLRAQNFNKSWTTTADFNTGTNSNIDTTGDEAKLVTSTSEFSEDFSTTTNYDAESSSNVSWDTTSNKLQLAGGDEGVVTDMTSKLNEIWGSDENVLSTTSDLGRGRVYYGGSKGSFGYFDGNDFVILTSEIFSFWSVSGINALVYDSIHDLVYLGGNTGKFAKYDEDGAVKATDLRSEISAFWSTSSVYALTYDSTHDLIYLGGGGGRFAHYDEDGTSGLKVTDLTSNTQAGTTWNAEEVFAIIHDNTNDLIYLGGDYEPTYNNFAKWDGATLTHLGSEIGFWGYRRINALTRDPSRNLVYLGGATGKFAKYDDGGILGSKASDLTAEISTFWSTGDIYDLSYDSVHDLIFLGGRIIRFAKYSENNTAGSKATDLSTEISSFWTSDLQTIVSVNGLLYLGGSFGRFVLYDDSQEAGSKATDLVNEIALTLTAPSVYASVFSAYDNLLYLGGSGGFAKYDPETEILTELNSEFSGAGHIYAFAYDSTNNLIYIGTSGGSFFKYDENGVSGSKATNLTDEISSFWGFWEIYSIAYDSTNDIIYLGGRAERFAKYDDNGTPGSRATDLTPEIAAFWDGHYGYVISMAYDTNHNLLYLGGEYGLFAKYDDNGTAGSKAIEIEIAGLSSDINAMLYLQSQGILYIASGSSIKKYDEDASGSKITSLPLYDAGLSYASHNSITTHGSNIYFGGGSASRTFVNYSYDSIKFGKWDGSTATDITSLIESSFKESASEIFSITATPSAIYLFGQSSFGTFVQYELGYKSSGYAVASALDSTVQNISSATLSATATTPEGSSITYYLSADDGSHWEEVSLEAEHQFVNPGSSLKIKASLTTNDNSVTPEVTALSLSYSYLTSATGTMSLVYDAGEDIVPTELSWNGTKPANTEMAFKLRSAESAFGLASATWSDVSSFSASPLNLLTLAVGEGAGVPENRFVEVYIAFTSSDGISNPVLADVTLEYVINLAPEIQALSATQSGDGSKVVNISYGVRDVDTDLNPYNRGEVDVSFQYSLDGINYEECTSITGAGIKAVGQELFTTYGAVWDVADELGGVYYGDSVKIKVVADDHEQAHNLATLESAAFTVDTIDPVINSIDGGGVGVQINSSDTWTNSPAVNLVLSASDDTATFMEIRNDDVFTQVKEAYATSKSGWVLSANDGSKTVYVRFYDEFGNNTDASANILLDTTPPAVPANFQVFDTSTADVGLFNITSTWDSVGNPGDFFKYYLERSSDGVAFTELATFSNIASNAYSDRGLNDSETYYYRLRSQDIHDNYSSYTEIKSAVPAGDDVTPPEITGPGPSSSAQDVTATITWLTSEAANSMVEFGTTTGYGSMQGSPEYVTNHSVTLVGLSPTTTYHYRVRSSDGSHNEVVSADYTFTTTLPQDAEDDPIITETASQKPGADPEEVTILWTTDKYSTSKVIYGTSQENLDMATEEDLTLNRSHFITISGLNKNTQYWYQVYSKDVYGNEAFGEVLTFTTEGGDIIAPELSADPIISADYDSATISWLTSEPSTSYIDYGLTESYGLIQGTPGLVSNHSVELVGLYPDTQYSFRIRSADGSNNELISGNYTLTTLADPTDVTGPVISNIQTNTLTHNSITITWDTDEVADSFVEYGTDLNYGWIVGTDTASSGHSVTLSGLSADTPYHFRPRSRDDSSNLSLGGDQTFSTLSDPTDVTGPVVSNISVTPGIFTTTISWSTDEDADSFVEFGLTASYGSSQGVNDSTTSHSVTIAGLNDATSYHFRIRSRDLLNNITLSEDQEFTTVVDPTDVTGPIISNVQTNTLTHNSITITWDTDEEADSYIEYGLTTEYGSIFGSGTQSTSHSITLSGLNPSSLYNFRTRSRDASSNLSLGENQTFTTEEDPADVTPPQVSNVAVDAGMVSATISWITDEEADSFIEFGEDVSYGAVYGLAEMETTHTIVVTGLSAGTQYHYRIRSRDATFNLALSNDSVFTTEIDPSDITSPVISTVNVEEGYNQAVISWATDEEATSFVEYYYGENQSVILGSLISRTDHSITVSGLEQELQYHYRLRSQDPSGNETVSDYETFTTLSDPTDVTGPVVSDISLEAEPYSITVSWSSDEASDSLLEYGTTEAYGQVQGKIEMTDQHSVSLAGLDPETEYHFRIRSRDSENNLTLGENLTLVTEKIPESTTLPIISGATVQKQETPDKVSIIWTTDKDAVSEVFYGADPNSLEFSVSDETLTKIHFVTLENLSVNSKYYYQVKSVDEYDNEITSEIKYFVTSYSESNMPSISAVKFSNVTLSSALISWDTDVIATSVIEYGQSREYGSKIEDQSSGGTTKHAVLLENLISGTEYHLRITGTGQDGSSISSDDYVFSTIPMPQISAVTISNIGSTSVKISWKFNIDLSGQVNYGVDSLDNSQGSNIQSKEHEINLQSLTPATTYKYQIQTIDSYGNIVKSPVDSFQTVIDTTPPVILDMKSEVSIIADSSGQVKAQAVISWSTDEPATSQVKYAMGVALADDYPLQTEEEIVLSNSHIVIITNLQPSATYHLRLLSKDSSGNIAVSDDYTILTLNQEKSLLQYIIQILEERFSWVKSFGFLGN